MKLRIALIVVAAGCGKATESAPASAETERPPVSASVSPAVDSAGRSAGSACPHTGLWQTCTLERRLKQAGFVVKRLEEKSRTRAGFSIEPVVYSLGASRLEAFIYEDEKSLAHDVALIDTVTVGPRGVASAWESTPMFIRSANLAVVLLTQNQRQAERVMLAITAGAPQPGSPR
jgi:hypothetical protein